MVPVSPAPKAPTKTRYTLGAVFAYMVPYGLGFHAMSVALRALRAQGASGWYEAPLYALVLVSVLVWLVHLARGSPPASPRLARALERLGLAMFVLGAAAGLVTVFFEVTNVPFTPPICSALFATGPCGFGGAAVVSRRLWVRSQN